MRARSLRRDRAVCVLGRYVATELCACSVATSRLSCVGARSLRSDLAWLELGRYVATEPCACSALAIGAVAAGVFLPALLRTAIFSFIFPYNVLIKRFAAMS
ncbi:hypothetical protein F2Q69_00052596 [Brassica cretica]|uniref:Uncharacterized protein n=1 Tax=Brassica cretica TaxID=69181 RepID=A0A8S9N513_BRACR|nr:hypothetical protein F2Q69_00052596 [Brassica cretica]